MSIDQYGAASPVHEPGTADAGAPHHDTLIKLAAGAIGIVFGDIGTSPLYAFRETFAGHHKLAVDAVHIMGVVSLMFWSMMIVVTLKYVTIIMRADNKGEGGSLALLALVSHRTKSGAFLRTGSGPAVSKSVARSAARDAEDALAAAEAPSGATPAGVVEAVKRLEGILARH